jgi:hypothetical protein
MNIQITPKVVLTSDNDNFILNKRTVVQKGKTKGEVKLMPFAYCGTLAHAAKVLLEKNLKWSEAESFKELEAEHEAFKKLVAEKFNVEIK